MLVNYIVLSILWTFGWEGISNIVNLVVFIVLVRVNVTCDKLLHMYM